MSKHWIGTSFAVLWTPPSSTDYAVWQKERCPATGRDHFQFYIRMKKLLPGDHIEMARDIVAAIKYCKKDSTRIAGPWEIGELGTDISKGPVELLKSLPVLGLLQEMPNLWRNYRTLKDLRVALAPSRTVPTQGLMLTGLTGTGKTKIASIVSSFVGVEETYQSDSTQWFDGYDSQSLLIVDEYRGQWPIDFLLKLLDRYPLRVPIKGGYSQFSAKMVIFTSNLTIDDMYVKLDEATRAAVKRRIVELRVY